MLVKNNYKASIKQVKIDHISWIYGWKNKNKLNFSLETGHFFLEGMFLDDFSKEMILNAKSEVFVVNPYVEECSLSNTFRTAKRKDLDVKIITREPEDRTPENKKFHRRLLEREKYHPPVRRQSVQSRVAVRESLQQ